MRAKLQAVRPVLMVRDVAASIAYYAKLGFELAFTDADTSPNYASMRRDGVELHLQSHAPEDFASGDRPTYRFLVSDVDALSAEFSDPSAALHRTEVWDTAWGTREFHVQDPDRNGLQFYRVRV